MGVPPGAGGIVVAAAEPLHSNKRTKNQAVLRLGSPGIDNKTF